MHGWLGAEVGVGMLRGEGIPSIEEQVSWLFGCLVSWFLSFLVSKFLGFKVSLVSWFHSFLVSCFLGFLVYFKKIFNVLLADIWYHLTTFPFHVFWNTLIPHSAFSKF